MTWVERLITAAEGGSAEKVLGVLAASPHRLARRIDGRGSDGATALMIGSWLGHAEVCELLLAAGADPLVRDETGKSAFSFATAADDRPDGRVRRGRALFAAYSGGAEYPRRYVIKIVRGSHTAEELRLARSRAIDALATRLGVRARKATNQDGEAIVWLLPSEVAGARGALGRGAGVMFTVEVTLYGEFADERER